MKVAKGDSADVDAAVAAAKDVFDDGAWSRAKPSFRRKVLTKVADLIEARSDDIIALQALEMGGPVGPKHRGPHPVAERSAWNFRFFAQEQELAGNESFNRDDNLLTYTIADRGRGVRADHAVERTVHAVDVEDGAVPRVRQLGGAQAVGAVAVVDPGAVRDLPGSRSARRACTTRCSASARKPGCRWSSTAT